jgi:peptidoglycan/LPS O-acetylase OafA/YrhL
MGFSWVFIQMFFVQSGYLITSLLLADKERGFIDYLKRFYWRRGLRIFPIYFLYLFTFLALYITFGKPEDFPLRAPLLFTYTYNFSRLLHIPMHNDSFFGHLWSLALEEQFYFVWPFLIYYLSVRNLKRLLIFIICLSPVFRLFFASYLATLGYTDQMVGSIVYMFTFSQFDAFAFGAAIPLFQLTQKIHRTKLWAQIFVIATILISVINYFVLIREGVSVHVTTFGLPNCMIANYQHVWSYTLIDLMFMFVILHLLTYDYKGLFNNSLMVGAGKIVYGIYVVHALILHVIKRHLGPSWISFSFACLLSYFVAYLSYRFYEKRFLNMKDYWDVPKRSASAVDENTAA